MQTFDVNIERSFDEPLSVRTRQVASMFDLEKHHLAERWKFRLSMPDRWQIGAIVGPSGSGKSTVLRDLFGDESLNFDWPDKGTVIDGFASSTPIKEVVHALSSVGFSSAPNWIRPFHVLSNGEKFRASLARCIVDARELAVIDEYTSVVDRTVAKIASEAFGKAIRSSAKRVVVASCHDDFLEWLRPDWVITMPSGSMTTEALRRSPIHLEVRRETTKSWELFARHHYLKSDISRSAACYVAYIDDRPVAFTSVVSFPHVKPAWKLHRTVCLPDYQGVGIGSNLSQFIASVYACSKRVLASNSSPSLIAMRAKSKVWRCYKVPSFSSKGTLGSDTAKQIARSSAQTRYVAGFEYIGPKDYEAARHFKVI